MHAEARAREDNMKLRLTTDYAIRLLLCISMNPDVQTAYDLGEKVNIPKATVVKIMGRLKQKNWITSHEGVTGGYRISVNLSDISFLDVLDAMDDNLEVETPRDDRQCATIDESYRSARDAYRYIRLINETMLSNVTLDKISRNNIQMLEGVYQSINREMQ